MRRALVALIVIVSVAQPVAAQSRDGDPFPWRKFVFPLVGGGLLGGAASFTPERGDGSFCDSSTCTTSIGVALGIGLGVLLGHELDKRATRHHREGPSLTTSRSAVALPEGSTGFAGYSGGILTLSTDGVGYVDGELRFHALAAGFQARAGTVMEGAGLAVVSSNSAVYGVPLGSGGPSVLLWETGAGSLADLGGGRLLVGELGRIRLASLTGREPDWALWEERTSATRGLPLGMKKGEGEIFWAVADSFLISYDGATLGEVGRLPLPGRGTALSLQGRTGIVSLGSDGVAVVNLSDQRAPSLTALLDGMLFAYGATAFDGRVYVAAGTQGVFVFDLTSPSTPRSLGVMRGFGFVADVLVHERRLHLLDRGRDEVVRLDTGVLPR